MNKNVVILGAIATVLLMTSTAIAMPVTKTTPVMSKVEDVKENINLQIKGKTLLQRIIEYIFYRINTRVDVLWIKWNNRWDYYLSDCLPNNIPDWIRYMIYDFYLGLYIIRCSHLHIILRIACRD